MVNRKIDLPSQRRKKLIRDLETHMLVNDMIEHPLRRKFRSERHCSRVYDYAVALLFIALLTALYLLVANTVDNQAKQAALFKKAQAAEVEPLCARYRTDTALNGTAAAETLKAICK